MKTIEERAQELANKSRYWTPGGAFEVRIDFFSEALTELADDLNADKEKEVAELKETNFALMKLYDAAPHAESCKFISPILRSELQDASGLYECDCWKSGSLDSSLLDEVKRVLGMAKNSALSWDMLGRAQGNIAVQIWREDALKLLTRLGGSHE